MFLRLIAILLGVLFSSTVLFSQESAEDVDSIRMSIDLDDVVVTAQYTPTDSRNALHKIRSIDKTAIKRRGAVNLEQLLSQEMNISISQDLILGSSLKMQGISGRNVKIMIDGVPVIGRVDDNIDLGQISLSNVERVEIVEGPLSVQYGTDALGGVINLITTKSQVKPFETRLISQVESTGATNLALQAGTSIRNKVLFRLDAERNNYDGYNTYTPDSLSERTFQWNPKTQWNLGGMLRYNFGNESHVRYSVSYFEEVVNNPGAIKRPQFRPYAFDETYLTGRLNHALMSEGVLNEKFFWNFTTSYNTFRRTKLVSRTDIETGGEEPVSVEQDTSIYHAVFFRPVIASRFDKSLLNFQAGLDIVYENGYGKRIQDETSAKENYSEIADYAAFAAIRYTPSVPLEVQIGLRAAHNTRFRAPWVPSVNLKYNLSKGLTLRGSYAKGFRSPSVKELFFYFIDANHFIIGNPELEAETSDNFQLNGDWEKTWSKSSFHLVSTSFYNDIRNKIELYDYVEVDGVKVPASSVGSVSSEYTYFNIDRFKSFGTSLRAGFSIGNWNLLAGVAPTGIYNPLSETTDSDAYTFQTELSSQVGYSFKKIGLHADVFMKFNDRQIRFYEDADEEGNKSVRQSIRDGYAQVDLNLSKSFWKDRISLSGGVKNLLDVKEVSTFDQQEGRHNSSGAATPISKGITFFTRLSVNLGW